MSDMSTHDALMSRNGEIFAGLHITVDLYDAVKLDQIDLIESCMRECVKACDASLLHIHLHHFTPNNGVTGVAVLAESHISVHTWPEVGFAAFDIFMCGDSQPEQAIDILRRTFQADNIDTKIIKRGENLA